jgi:hypothetical protein
MHRPSGITILALLYVLSGGINLVLSWVTIAVGGRPASECDSPSDAPREPVPAAADQDELELQDGLLGSGAALCHLFAAVGLWTLRPWGWRFALTGVSFSLLTHLVSAVQGARTPAIAVGTLVNLAGLIYLTRPHVRQAFLGVPLVVPTSR